MESRPYVCTEHLTKVVYMWCMSTSPEGQPHSIPGGDAGVYEPI